MRRCVMLMTSLPLFLPGTSLARIKSLILSSGEARLKAPRSQSRGTKHPRPWNAALECMRRKLQYLSTNSHLQLPCSCPGASAQRPRAHFLIGILILYPSTSTAPSLSCAVASCNHCASEAPLEPPSLEPPPGEAVPAKRAQVSEPSKRAQTTREPMDLPGW